MISEIIRWTFRTGLAFLVGSIVVVAVLRFVPPALTPLMVKRLVEAPFTGHSLLIRHRWVSASNISPTIFRAVVGGEDAGFMRHNGVDWNAVKRAERANPGRVKRGKPPLGASTITMQTAKNVFLLPIRSMVRKAFEVYFTYLIEAIWGKARILEVYVNMIEWGDGIYGIQAASRHYTQRDAAAIDAEIASRLAAVVPNPRRFRADAPSPYTRRRQAFIRGRMGGVAIPKELRGETSQQKRSRL
ncbi:MAG: monofunctional biosynthetic peptidoglycan transglycosylase [Candidatus Kapabacteria bacterium]|nr:monofunctional biosynthetic peptidoglycan transglycosylase [Candidatus Kapabacteria bacterium]